MKKSDIVIIGAGIAGITAAIYLKRMNSDFIIIEGKEIGGKLNQIPVIENYPGILKTSGKEISNNLKKQLDELDIKITKGNIQTILKDSQGFRVVSDIDSYICKSVIVASGISQISSSIKGEKEYSGRGVSYCATCDGNFFKNQDIAVIGNNDIALEESLYLSQLAHSISLFVSSNVLEGNIKLINNIKENNKIKIYYNSKVEEIVGDDLGVSSIKTNVGTFNVSGVFPYFGIKTSTEFLLNLHPNIVNNCLIVNEKMETNVSGLFAAGDIVNKNLRQLVTSSSDGAIAATNAFVFVKTNK